jgi:hypothetical protein
MIRFRDHEERDCLHWLEAPILFVEEQQVSEPKPASESDWWLWEGRPKHRVAPL